LLLLEAMPRSQPRPGWLARVLDRPDRPVPKVGRERGSGPASSTGIELLVYAVLALTGGLALLILFTRLMVRPIGDVVTDRELGNVIRDLLGPAALAWLALRWRRGAVWGVLVTVAMLVAHATALVVEAMRMPTFCCIAGEP
jgi:hypothetical protein